MSDLNFMSPDDLANELQNRIMHGSESPISRRNSQFLAAIEHLDAGTKQNLTFAFNSGVAEALTAVRKVLREG